MTAAKSSEREISFLVFLSWEKKRMFQQKQFYFNEHTDNKLLQTL